MSAISIDYDTFIKLVGLTVRAYPDTGCERPDTFAFLKEMEDGNKTNLGITEEDYRSGYAYGRKFETLGYNIKQFEKRYPLVLSEINAIDLEGEYYQNECAEVSIIVMDKISCENCPEECQRSRLEVELGMMRVTKNLIKQLREAIAYKAVKGVDEFILWGYPDLMAYYVAQGEIDSFTDTGRQLQNVINLGNSIRLIPYANSADQVCGYAFNTRICFCGETVDSDFDWAFKKRKYVPLTKCYSCS